MVARTRDSSFAPPRERRSGNPHAVAAVVVGLAAVLVIPVAEVIQYYSVEVTLIQSTISAAPAIAFGLWAIALARRGRFVLARTIGRAGGARTARTGRLLGWLGLTMGMIAALSVGFYGLLTIFAKS
jgi:hypothetical protein